MAASSSTGSAIGACPGPDESLCGVHDSPAEDWAAEPGPRRDYFIERDGVRFAGTHLIVDLHGARRLDDPAGIDSALRQAVQSAGAELLHVHLHRFTPNGGVSGVALLSESHISIHTWPERGFAALDVFMCGGARPRATLKVFERAFEPEVMEVREHRRGRRPAAQPGGAD